ncbi:hypothetical protein ABI59_20120 [Acidobacteria bacterium Mor1]|nr:hypothetical protein ABI59_20120 [Acidobacteria bacterium Mor1]
MSARRLCLAAIILFAVLLPAYASQSTSASFVLHQSTVNSGGDESASASFVLTGSVGQETAVGASSAGTSYVLQSGFWSFAGSGLVPVVLAVDRNDVTPENLDLNWSGNNPPYSIYRSADCGDVLSSLFDSTPANDYEDIAPLASSLECFNVLATAPGPAPPPGSLP